MDKSQSRYDRMMWLAESLFMDKQLSSFLSRVIMHSADFYTLMHLPNSRQIYKKTEVFFPLIVILLGICCREICTCQRVSHSLSTKKRNLSYFICVAALSFYSMGLHSTAEVRSCWLKMVVHSVDIFSCLGWCWQQNRAKWRMDL